jgi:hypothetical protein
MNALEKQLDIPITYDEEESNSQSFSEAKKREIVIEEDKPILFTGLPSIKFESYNTLE